MSTFFETKNMIHICAEIITLIGITIYFSQKNKTMIGYIEALSKKIAEQEEIISKNTKSIETLSVSLQQIQKYIQTQQVQQVQQVPKVQQVQQVQVQKSQKAQKTQQPREETNNKGIPVQMFESVLGGGSSIISDEITSLFPVLISTTNKDDNDKNRVVDVTDDVNESDLDDEISEELEELKETE